MTQIALHQGGSTDTVLRSLENLSLEGQPCQVGLPEEHPPTREPCLTDDVEDRSAHLDEESSSDDSLEKEPRTQETILREAGVEIVLEELSCTEDGKAPLELVTQVPCVVRCALAVAACLLPA